MCLYVHCDGLETCRVCSQDLFYFDSWDRLSPPRSISDYKNALYGQRCVQELLSHEVLGAQFFVLMLMPEEVASSAVTESAELW